MTNELDLTGLPEEAVKRLSGYLGKMIEIIGDELKSIVVYGSAVAGEFDSKRSNINLVITVDKLKLDLLHRVQPLVKKGTRKGIVAPLFLTVEHMNTSSDVFPIEFLDMSDFHKTVCGKDPFTKLDIGIENLRLECEEKLKGSLINLRQSYLEVADRRSSMMNLVSASITGITSIFRGLIRISGKSAPASKRDVILLAADLYPVKADNFLKALEIKLSTPRMTRDEMDAFFAAYLADIETLALHVDKMSKKRPRKRAKGGAKKPRKATPGKKTARKPSTKRVGKKAPVKKKASAAKAKKKPAKKTTKTSGPKKK